MIYLISEFPCTIISDIRVHIEPNVKYCVENVDNEDCIVIGQNRELPLTINFSSSECSKNILHFNYKQDEYFILVPTRLECASMAEFKFKSNTVCVSTASELNITLAGKKILNARIEGISYSHYELLGEICVIYFEGESKYVVVIKGDEVKYHNYYDEINIEGDDRFFMTKCHDSLNHGRVLSIKGGDIDDYLIYLDDSELKMKDEFTYIVFLDCVLAHNLKYANELLDESIRPNDKKDIEAFLGDFDDYVVLDENTVAIKKEDTMLGIFRFEIQNKKIINIINL